MGKFFTAVKRGFQAMGKHRRASATSSRARPSRVYTARTTDSSKGRAQLNTAGLTFFNLDWANRSAATLICTSCGGIDWYLTDPEEVG